LAPGGKSLAGLGPAGQQPGSWGAGRGHAPTDTDAFGTWQTRQQAAAEGGATAWGTPAPGGQPGYGADAFSEPTPGRGTRAGRPAWLTRQRMIGAGAVLGVIVLVVVVILALGGGGGGSAPSATTALASATTLPSAGASASAGALPAKYSSAIEKSFVNECLKTSGGKVAFCNCALSQFEKSYTQASFLELNRTTTSARSHLIVNQVAAKCLGER
jgi:hypothetical protein